MRNINLFKCVFVLLVCALLFSGVGCTSSKEDKIPITTSSEKAMEYFLKGRALSEKLRAQESLQFFEKATTKDPNFAICYLYLSGAQPSAKGFFEKLNKAVALAEKVTEGEQLWILGVQAGVNAFPMKQREYYQELVKVYPNDERAHNLLGLNFFGQQEYAQAIEEFKKATKINPEFSQPYNQMGYAYRFLEDYTSAEEAFKQYIKLIPDDPNPYDSYAELLLRMGKYDESVKYYKKALAVNPNFVASHLGIATNFNYMGKHEDARKQLKELYDMARNNGERRAAHFATTISYVAEGNFGKAQEELEKQYALAEKINDSAAMAGDFGAMGNILLEAGEIDEALAKFEKSVELIQGSDLSQEIKNNSNRFFLFNSARIALKKNDFTTARTNAKEFQEQVKAINNPFQIRLSHGLAGMIALEEKDFDKAIEELEQANQQNPYTFYRMALAYEGKDNKEKAKEFYKKAGNFNALNSLNQVFIRSKAKKKLTEM